MSEPLPIPRLLRGAWEHLVILTYGVDAPFFERSLWRELSGRCKNILILADGQRALDAQAQYAEHGAFGRYLNQRYVLDGIFDTRAMHAKMLLLANRDAGRLLVGSGNLGRPGYASGGELFTRYEYVTGEPDHLDAFAAVRGLLQTLIARGGLGPSAARHLEHLFEKAPWLPPAPAGNSPPVRHNLEHSFLHQLGELVGDEPVEKLWVHAPFFDERATALAALLDRFVPGEVRLLIQPGRTSVDPGALEKLFRDRNESWRVLPVHLADSEQVYLHAKLILLQTASRSICLQGSPNLSHAALLWSGERANLELANLLTGPAGHFDDVFEALEIGPAVEDLGSLDVAYLGGPEEEEEADEFAEGLRLLRAEWDVQKLQVYYRGALPEIRDIALMIGDARLPLRVAESLPGLMVLDIPLPLSGSPDPVRIVWPGDDGEVSTNPIFACNRAALDELLDIELADIPLNDSGELDLDDDNLEALLLELEAELVIDDRSVWRVLGEKRRAGSASVSEGAALSYDDIDYELLRNHPRLQRYRQAAPSESALTGRPSALQILLGAIMANFKRLSESDPPGGADGLANALDTGLEDAETESEREAEDAAGKKQRRSRESRLRQILQNFIGRYLNGFRNPEFQELVGFEVVIKNYVIFAHILWHLFRKEWMEPVFLTNAHLTIWKTMWGDDEQRGYLAHLQEAERKAAQDYLAEHHAAGHLLAGLYYVSELASEHGALDVSYAPRNFWRALLLRAPFLALPSVWEDAWVFLSDTALYHSALPNTVFEGLSRLAKQETNHSFLRALEVEFSLPEGSLRFERQRVYRPPAHAEISTECLVVRTQTGIDHSMTMRLLESLRWRYGWEFFRLSASDSSWLLWYDEPAGSGLYFDRVQEKVEDEAIGRLPAPTPPDWAFALEPLQESAVRAEARLRIEKPARVQASGKISGIT